MNMVWHAIKRFTEIFMNICSMNTSSAMIINCVNGGENVYTSKVLVYFTRSRIFWDIYYSIMLNCAFRHNNSLCNDIDSCTNINCYIRRVCVRRYDSIHFDILWMYRCDNIKCAAFFSIDSIEVVTSPYFILKINTFNFPLFRMIAKCFQIYSDYRLKSQINFTQEK